jgi:hypothetical protein
MTKSIRLNAIRISSVKILPISHVDADDLLAMLQRKRDQAAFSKGTSRSQSPVSSAGIIPRSGRLWSSLEMLELPSGAGDRRRRLAGKKCRERAEFIDRCNALSRGRSGHVG